MWMDCIIECGMVPVRSRLPRLPLHQNNIGHSAIMCSCCISLCTIYAVFFFLLPFSTPQHHTTHIAAPNPKIHLHPPHSSCMSATSSCTVRFVVFFSVFIHFVHFFGSFADKWALIRCFSTKWCNAFVVCCAKTRHRLASLLGRHFLARLRCAPPSKCRDTSTDFRCCCWRCMRRQSHLLVLVVVTNDANRQFHRHQPIQSDLMGSENEEDSF